MHNNVMAEAIFANRPEIIIIDYTNPINKGGNRMFDLIPFRNDKSYKGLIPDGLWENF